MSSSTAGGGATTGGAPPASTSAMDTTAAEAAGADGADGAPGAPPPPSDVPRDRLGPDVDCVLCHRLLFEPVSLACGHSFCKACLQRALRYSPHCPNCRAPVHYDAALPVSICLRSIIESALPVEYAERRAEAAAEAADAADAGTGRLPLFILSGVVFPGATQRFCIFEPRYLLMLQRIMQGSRRFGFVSLRRTSSGSSGALCKVGCVLEVTKCLRMRDNRYIIDTVGRDRFTILDSEELDGYMVARTAVLVDEPETPEAGGSDGDRNANPESGNRARPALADAEQGEQVVRSRQLSLVSDAVSRQDSAVSSGPGSRASFDFDAPISAVQTMSVASDGERSDVEGGVAGARPAHSQVPTRRPVRRAASVAAYARRLVDEVIAAGGANSWTGPTVANVLRAAGPPPRPEEGATKLGLWLADRLITDVSQRQALLEETDPAQRLIAISLILERANNISVPASGFAGGCTIT